MGYPVWMKRAANNPEFTELILFQLALKGPQQLCNLVSAYLV